MKQLCIFWLILHSQLTNELPDAVVNEEDTPLQTSQWRFPFDFLNNTSIYNMSKTFTA